MPSQDPTVKDVKFFMCYIKNMKNKPEVDWNVIAQEMGLANGSTASTRFGQIKKKYIDGGIGGTPSPAKPRAKKSEVGSGTNITPSKVTKPKGRPTKKAKAEALAQAAAHELEVKEESMVNEYANANEFANGYDQVDDYGNAQEYGNGYDDDRNIQFYDPNEGMGDEA
ncbi:uncharacterized protein PAC_03572 [Phialocephala subalpina]|uniref:Myb-like DNA-binding domain-containing protein n=1 Tax=Phialocephala subalpina TaxID=576137 RepID=A0A1L7WLP7_9HELO|nr:uncharacterized protein PAC_03572 [Phialocephala subalpina]